MGAVTGIQSTYALCRLSNAAAAVAAYAGSAGAHHSAAMFDTTQNVTIDGIVTKYEWRNPHVYMTLRVTDAGGKEREQLIEAGASSVLLPLGLAPTSVVIGERVTIRGNPTKSASATAVLGRELVKADGSVLPLNIGSSNSSGTAQHAHAANEMASAIGMPRALKVGTATRKITNASVTT